MARSLELLTASQISLLEVCGFDLLAQVEALLRHSREYQRDLHRLHRTAANAAVLGAVRRQVHHLRQTCASLQRTLEVIRDTDHEERGIPADPEPDSKTAILNT